MNAKTALLVAVGIAVGLPYVTAAFLEGGRIGYFAFGGLFVGVFLLVIFSDLRGADTAAETKQSE